MCCVFILYVCALFGVLIRCGADCPRVVRAVCVAKACFVGKLSSWPKLDASDEQLRVRSERAFKQELAWAAHLSLGAVLMPTPVFPAANYARATLRVLSSLTFLQLFVRIPVCIAKATTAGGAVANTVLQVAHITY